MKIKYTEWRDAVRFSSTYDSTKIWKRVEKAIKEDIELKIIDLSIEDFNRINENTIIAILTNRNGADWTKRIKVIQGSYWDVSLYDYLEELCNEIEHEVIFDDRELEDYGDIRVHQRKEIKE